MDYSYNYGYLQQFMDSHRLAKKDLLGALGCQDYVSLNKWLDGKVPVHITAMLRFCNFYNVPLSNFFVDGDGMPADFAPTLPDDRAQLLPTDGYGMREGKGRGIVETRITKRETNTAEQAKVVAEGLKRQAEQRNKRDAALAEIDRRQSPCETTISDSQEHERKSTTAADNALTETILRMKLDHSEEIHKLEREHHEKEDTIRARFDAERDRLLAIIEQQQKEISRLSGIRNIRNYDIDGNNNFMGVAERDSK